MAKQPESRLQKKVQDVLKKEFGGFWSKYHGGPFSLAGMPDLLGCVDGWFFALEIKLPKKSSKPSAIQEATIKRIVESGGVACVVRSPEEAVSIVRQCLKLHPQVLRELLRYEPDTGKLYWRERDRRWFETDHHCNRWNSHFANKLAGGRPDSRGYVRIRVLTDRYKLHRVIWALCHGYWPRDQIDHIDQNPSNNRIENLREACNSDNARNRKLSTKNKSGCKGVNVYKPNGKWVAKLKHEGKLLHLGYFDKVEDAIKARKAAEKKYGY